MWHHLEEKVFILQIFIQIYCEKLGCQRRGDILLIWIYMGRANAILALSVGPMAWRLWLSALPACLLLMHYCTYILHVFCIDIAKISHKYRIFITYLLYIFVSHIHHIFVWQYIFSPAGTDALHWYTNLVCDGTIRCFYSIKLRIVQQPPTNPCPKSSGKKS